MNKPIALEMKGVTKTFGSIVANNNVDLTVYKGEILAILYTVISPISMPLETVMLPIYASELFGKQSYSTILGIFVSVNTAGFCVGGWVMNLCYDMMGTYYYALIAVGIVMLILLGLLQVILTLGKREKLKKASV